MHIILSFLIAAVAIWVGIVLIPITVKNDIYRLAFTTSDPGGLKGPIPLPMIGGNPASVPSSPETGTLAGTVKVVCGGCDAASVLRNREILITNADQGVSRSVPIGSGGGFAAELPAGRYYVDISKSLGEKISPLPGYVFILPNEELPLDVTIRLP